MNRRVRFVAIVLLGITAPALAGPKLVVEKDKVDLGPIKEGTKVDITYVLENAGDEALVIDKVVTGCGCTKVELTDEQKTIPPGAKLELLTTFNSTGRAGTKSNWVRVESNDPEKPTITLTFDVEVVVLARILPNSKLNFRNLNRGEQVVRELDVLPIEKGASAEIVSFDMPAKELAVSQKPIESEGQHGYRLTFRVDDKAPLGPVMAEAKLVVKVGQEVETKIIEITGNVAGDFLINPMVLQQTNLAIPYVRGLALRPVQLKSTTGQPIKIISAAAGPYFDVAVESDAKGVEHEFRVTINDRAPDGPISSWLEIATDSLVQPQVRIPVFANVMPHIQADPPAVLLKRGVNQADKPQLVMLESSGMAAFNIESVTCDQSYVRASELVQEPPRIGFRVIQLTLAEGSPPGELHAVVTVTTDFPGAREFSLPVTVID